MGKYKVFSKKGFCHPVVRGQTFRVGWDVGRCVLNTPWFAVMKRWRS